MALPPHEKLVESVDKLFREVGATNLTRRVLVKRLGAEYSIDFEPFKKDLDAIVIEVMQSPNNKKAVAKAAKEVKAKADKPKKEKSSKSKKADKEKGAKDKKAKRERAEGEPKRATSAYFFFADDNRAALMTEVKDANGGKLNMGELGKKMGDLWAAATPDVKAKYELRAQQDKLRYADELKAFEDAGGKKGGAKKVEKPDGPKRPMNASFMYVNQNREAYKKENPTASLGDISKALSERYKNLSDSEKQIWLDKAAADKSRYDAEVAALKK